MTCTCCCTPIKTIVEREVLRGVVHRLTNAEIVVALLKHPQVETVSWRATSGPSHGPFIVRYEVNDKIYDLVLSAVVHVRPVPPPPRKRWWQR